MHPYLIVSSSDVVRSLSPVCGLKNAEDVTLPHLISLSLDLIVFAFRRSQVATDLNNQSKGTHELTIK